MIASYDKGKDPRFFDIHFAPFQQDPSPIIPQLYDFLGKDLTLRDLARINTWRDNTPKENRGRHECHLKEFELTKGALRERFRFYLDHLVDPVAA